MLRLDCVMARTQTYEKHASITAIERCYQAVQEQILWKDQVRGAAKNWYLSRTMASLPAADNLIGQAPACVCTRFTLFARVEFVHQTHPHEPSFATLPQMRNSLYERLGFSSMSPSTAAQNASVLSVLEPTTGIIPATLPLPPAADPSEVFVLTMTTVYATASSTPMRNMGMLHPIVGLTSTLSTSATSSLTVSVLPTVGAQPHQSTLDQPFFTLLAWCFCIYSSVSLFCLLAMWSRGVLDCCGNVWLPARTPRPKNSLTWSIAVR